MPVASNLKRSNQPKGTQKFSRSLLLFAFILLLDHLARHLFIVREDQLRHLGDILVDLAELVFDFELIGQGQGALEDFEIGDVLVEIYLCDRINQTIKLNEVFN